MADNMNSYLGKQNLTTAVICACHGRKKGISPTSK